MVTSAVARRTFIKGMGAAFLAGAMPGSGMAAAIAKSSDALFDDHDALGLAELIRQKKVTSQELVEIVIRRIELLNPTLNCVSIKHYDLARELSRSALPEGPFRGVPILLKDLFTSYKGTKTTNGSSLFGDLPAAEQDDVVIERMKRAGFVLVGKTTTPEFGWSISTESAFHGYTRNPWNLEQSSGGSSGGASAAVAARILPLAWASDGAGSIRVPASTCGLVGLKSSRGRLPFGPEAADAMHGAATNGCVSRTVRDTAAFIDALKGSLPGDIYALPPSPPFLAEVTKDPGRLKIGFTRRCMDAGAIDPECVRAVEKAARKLADLGHDVQEMAFDFDYAAMKSDFITMVAVGSAPMYDFATSILGRPPSTKDLSPVALEILDQGRGVSGSDFDAVLARLRQFGREIARQSSAFDVVITPTLPELPAKLGYYDPLSLTANAFHERFFHGNNFLVPFNVSGQPAMTLPLHWSSTGLPVGVQIVGAWGGEAVLFRLAGQLEQQMPWRDRKPPVSA